MGRTTLGEIREYVEELGRSEGAYALVCGRTGESPVPASGLRFESRAVARAAASAVEQYRETLRRYDPRVPRYDIIVCERHESMTWSDLGREESRWTREPEAVPPSDTPVFETGEDADELVEFCHGVAATVFETLAEHEYPALRSGIMEAYFELAQRHSTADRLCLRLIERMATALAEELPPQNQVTLLSAVATKLDTRAGTRGDGNTGGEPTSLTTGGEPTPLEAVLAELRTVGLLGTYECRRRPGYVETGPATNSVTLDGYVLSPCEGRLPLLPILVELYRRRDIWLPVSTCSTDDGWRVEFERVDVYTAGHAPACTVAPEVA